MKVQVNIYSGGQLIGLRFFRTLRAAQNFCTRIARERSSRVAWVHEITRR